MSESIKLKDGLECAMDENKCANSRKYDKSDIIALAKKCGVDTSGTRKDICARIAKSISAGEYKSERNECVTMNPTIKELIDKYTRDELLTMCKERNMNCQSFWTKEEIARSLVACSSSKMSPVCIPELKTYSHDELQTKTNQELYELCRERNIKALKSWPKKELIKAFESCMCTVPSIIDDKHVEPDKTFQSFDDLTKMSIADLKNAYKKELTQIKNRPDTKKELVQYVDSIQKDKRCKSPDWTCEDDFYCDASNQPNPGVCVPKDTIDKRVEREELYSIVWKGKTIYGNKTALKAFQQKQKEIVSDSDSVAKIVVPSLKVEDTPPSLKRPDSSPLQVPRVSPREPLGSPPRVSPREPLGSPPRGSPREPLGSPPRGSSREPLGSPPRSSPPPQSRRVGSSQLLPFASRGSPQLSRVDSVNVSPPIGYDSSHAYSEEPIGSHHRSPRVPISSYSSQKETDILPSDFVAYQNVSPRDSPSPEPRRVSSSQYLPFASRGSPQSRRVGSSQLLPFASRGSPQSSRVDSVHVSPPIGYDSSHAYLEDSIGSHHRSPRVPISPYSSRKETDIPPSDFVAYQNVSPRDSPSPEPRRISSSQYLPFASRGSPQSRRVGSSQLLPFASRGSPQSSRVDSVHVSPPIGYDSSHPYSGEPIASHHRSPRVPISPYSSRKETDIPPSDSPSPEPRRISSSQYLPFASRDSQKSSVSSTRVSPQEPFGVPPRYSPKTSRHENPCKQFYSEPKSVEQSKQLDKLTVKQLKDSYTEQLLPIKNKPETKKELIQYLDSILKYKRCKSPDWACEDDFYCDASSQPNPGVCVPKDTIDKRVERGELDSIEWNGKKIYGNKTTLKAFQQQKETVIPDVVSLSQTSRKMDREVGTSPLIVSKTCEKDFDCGNDRHIACNVNTYKCDNLEKTDTSNMCQLFLYGKKIIGKREIIEELMTQELGLTIPETFQSILIDYISKHTTEEFPLDNLYLFLLSVADKIENRTLQLKDLQDISESYVNNEKCVRDSSLPDVYNLYKKWLKEKDINVRSPKSPVTKSPFERREPKISGTPRYTPPNSPSSSDDEDDKTFSSVSSKISSVKRQTPRDTPDSPPPQTPDKSPPEEPFSSASSKTSSVKRQTPRDTPDRAPPQTPDKSPPEEPFSSASSKTSSVKKQSPKDVTIVIPKETPPQTPSSDTPVSTHKKSPSLLKPAEASEVSLENEDIEDLLEEVKAPIDTNIKEILLARDRVRQCLRRI